MPDTKEERQVTECQYCGTEGCPSCLPNDNCLYGIECPKCKSKAPFDIATSLLMRWDDDGTDWSKYNDSTDFDGGDKAFIRCYECNHEGTVGGFRTEEYKKEFGERDHE